MKSERQPTPRTRDPEATRQAILGAAFREIHRNGFRAARLDAILDEAGVTKGALYHHFGSKSEMGLAVLEEMVRASVVDRFLAPLAEHDDPIDGLIEITRRAVCEVSPVDLECGCPLNNLAQEMAGVDGDFQERLASIFNQWRSGVTEQLRRGQATGAVRADLDVERAAAFIVAAWEGTIGLAKAVQDLAVIQACGEQFPAYLETLRATPS